MADTTIQFLGVGANGQQTMIPIRVRDLGDGSYIMAGQDAPSNHPVDVDLSSTDATFTAPYPRAFRVVGAGNVDLIGSGDTTNAGVGTHVVVPCADGETVPISPKKIIKATTTVTRVIALY